MEKQKCKICNNKRTFFFEKKVLSKYEISYFRCTNCGFIQTEDPYWLEESYSEAITSLDVGLVARNMQYADYVGNLIYKVFDRNKRFLDFAGGYGLFTRIMRDKGYDFFNEDKYCENIFAKNFSLENLLKEEREFELVTSFEFMEHSEDPHKELKSIFSLTKHFLFSTVFVPEKDIPNWWYLNPEHGQHISFYTKESLQELASMYGKNYYNKGNLHLFTEYSSRNILSQRYDLAFLLKKVLSVLNSKKGVKSRTNSDFEIMKKRILK